MDAVFVEGYRHWAWPIVILAALTLVATFALMVLRSIVITDTFLRMSLTISDWMECLHVSREHFNGGDVRPLVRSPQCDAIVRGILRGVSKCGINKAVLAAVEKWREGGGR